MEWIEVLRWTILRARRLGNVRLARGLIICGRQDNFSVIAITCGDFLAATLGHNIVPRLVNQPRLGTGRTRLTALNANQPPQAQHEMVQIDILKNSDNPRHITVQLRILLFPWLKNQAIRLKICILTLITLTLGACQDFFPDNPRILVRGWLDNPKSTLTAFASSPFSAIKPTLFREPHKYFISHLGYC